jgi:hypothetical protein
MEKKSNNTPIIVIFILGLLLFFYFKSPHKKVESTESAVEEVQATQPPADPRTEVAPVAVPAAGWPLSITKEEVEKIRSESKATLAFMSDRLKSFKNEKKRYSTDFVGLGARPPDNAMIKQKYGFLEDFVPQQLVQYDEYVENPRNKDSDFYIGQKMEYGNDIFYYADRVQNVSLSKYRKYCKNNCTADKDTFEMILAVPLGDDSHVDVWTVNEKSEMTQVQDGVTSKE